MSQEVKANHDLDCSCWGLTPPALYGMIASDDAGIAQR